MDRLSFFSTVHVRRDKDYPIEEIDSVVEAMAFLREWPVGRRGPVYRCALNSCSAAMAAQMTAEEARRSFASFARITGLLIEEGFATAPHLAEKEAKVKRAAR